MKNIEFSSKKDSVGRRKVKIILHEIHNSNVEFNHNGITWLEQYVKENLSSAEGIPLCCQFLDDDNDVPLGHGEVSEKDGQIIIENSVVVGTVQRAYIDTVEVNGKSIKAVIGEGVVYSNRYPKFIRWMEEKLNNGESVDSSVEIAGLIENDNRIVYEGGYKEKGRIPKIFSYIGHAILSIPPADDNAVLLELNSKNNIEEDLQMKDTVVELNNKIDEQRTEINSLQAQVKDNEAKVTELNEKVSVKETELNSTIAELKEVNARLSDKEKELEDEKEKSKKLETEVNSLLAFKQEIENKKLVTELNGKLAQYTEEEKSVAKEKIETFNKEPKAETMNEIISEINSAIAQKIVAERSKQTEVNSKAADIYSDVYEVNSDSEDVSVEDLY